MPKERFKFYTNIWDIASPRLAEAIETLTPSFLIIKSDTGLSAASQEYLQYFEQLFFTDLLWVAYYQSKKDFYLPYKSPFNTRDFFIRKFSGLVYSKQLDLCYGLYEYMNESKIDFYIDWWREQMLETRHLEQDLRLKTRKPNKKTRKIASLRKKIAVLEGSISVKKQQNLIADISKDSPERAILYRLSINLAKNNKQFEMLYWKPYLKSIRDSVRHLEQNKICKIAWCNSDRILTKAPRAPPILLCAPER